ncbi:hypothetical protein MKW98_007266 [Papaver atlanticum]|uniref:Phospholipase A1 n=1 Tax=Papaver atlanticum TaxID=357466 RepID=A0AAD4TAU4_9MAGN|nr:hypothetical protein MKW98_007266 [Papaver atlanticum]
MGSIARRWRELNGQSYWENLIDPLDIDLRVNILHYGEMAQATYDTFNNEKLSKFQGRSLYHKRNLFSKVFLPKHSKMYEVTRFIYATSAAWAGASNWMGFVAVATDDGKVELGRREIVIAWRGTVRTLDWLNDLDIIPVSASEIFRGTTSSTDEPKVYHGSLSIYQSKNPLSRFNKSSARDQVLAEVRRLVEAFKNEEISITVTGHSLGGALGTLNAADIVANEYNKSKEPNKSFPVTAIVFASPRVGDENFKHVISGMEDLRLLRIRNALDFVPHWPLVGYSDPGVELTIDTHKSPYLKGPGDFSSWHNLEAYLHGVAGSQGNGEFKLQVCRNLALINKKTNNLKDIYHIPESWWCEQNKGMVQDSDGSWRFLDNEVDDV